MKSDFKARLLLTTTATRVLAVLVDQFVEEKMHAQGITAKLFERATYDSAVVLLSYVRGLALKKLQVK